MADDRARRLAAIEARLNPSSADPDAGSGTGNSTPSSTSSAKPASAPLFGAPRNLPKAWTRPSEREQTEKKRELARVLNRTVIRDNSYAAAAGCVETLLKIAKNIQTSNEDKFRTLKADNSVLQKKVLQVSGGREFMILMGFHTETRNFVQHFILDQSERRMYELGLAAEVLQEALPTLQARVNVSNVSKTAHKAEEAARVAAAKRQIEDDREAVRERAERERVAREARAAAQQQQELDKMAKEAATMATGEQEDDDDEDDDDEEPTVDGYTIDRRWGHGRKLNEE